MIAAGTYTAVVAPVDTEFGQVACQFGKSKEKGTPQVVVNFEILSGPFAAQRISWFGYFSDSVGSSGKSVTDRTLESLRSCGFKGDDLDKFAAQRPEIEVQIVVEHETYEGKTRAKVAWVNTAGRGVRVANPMDKKEMGLFAARFKSKLKGLPSIEGTKAERQAPSGAPPSGEDRGDDPFTDSRSFDNAPPAGADDDIPF